MIIDHVGVVVRSLQRGIEEWETLFGYRQISPVIDNALQRVRIVFLGKEGSLCVKLLEPSTGDSPIAGFAARGGGLHHLCFRSQEIHAAVSGLVRGGARLVVSPQPGEAFLGHDIAFCMAPGNLNIELVDSEEKLLFASDK